MIVPQFSEVFNEQDNQKIAWLDLLDEAYHQLHFFMHKADLIEKLMFSYMIMSLRSLK
ncbi:hypothetical protein ABIE26_001950 [Pedobacter africanus]|uniref:Uncharacterized protein n=1 Tax=Pedobacter africanus TaxID=151894 RepID=A0ACC6KQU2_9SPHI|nr:hypothetical protein [Pedobacter africanus]